MTVIDDLTSHYNTYWDVSVTAKPHIYNQSKKFNMDGKTQFAVEDVIYISNPRSTPRFADPCRSIKDTPSRVYIEIIGSTDGKRDNMFAEAYRMVEATGVAGYDNWIIHDYKHLNQMNKFVSTIDITLIKLNELVGR